LKYIEAPEVRRLAERLKDEHPQLFSHVDTQEILFTKYVADRGFGRAAAKIQIVREPYSLLTSKKFILSVKASKWKKMTLAQKAILVFHEMLHIKQFDPPKLLHHDVEDFKVVIQKFGLDWPANKNVKSPLKNP